MAERTWVIDPTHSEIQFKIKHLMISNVTGSFHKLDASVETEGDDFTTAKVNFTADVDSISTNNEQRDGHLKSPDFFDVANHPTINFVGTVGTTTLTPSPLASATFNIPAPAAPEIQTRRRGRR